MYKNIFPTRRWSLGLSKATVTFTDPPCTSVRMCSPVAAAFSEESCTMAPCDVGAKPCDVGAKTPATWDGEVINTLSIHGGMTNRAILADQSSQDGPRTNVSILSSCTSKASGDSQSYSRSYSHRLNQRRRKSTCHQNLTRQVVQEQT